MDSGYPIKHKLIKIEAFKISNQSFQNPQIFQNSSPPSPEALTTAVLTLFLRLQVGSVEPVAYFFLLDFF